MLSPIITIFIVFFALFITIYFRSIYEINHFIDTKIDIKSDKIDKEYSFLFLTDLHEKEYGANNETLINYINSNNKDIIIGGDLIIFTKRNNKDNNYYTKNTIELINKLSLNNKIYYAYGNHELRLKYKQDDNEKIKYGYNEFYNTLIDNNVIVLDNKYIDINQNIRLYGYSLNNKYYKKRKNINIDYTEAVSNDIKNNIKDFDNTKYNICLLHNPDFAELLINYGFDMILSGHHHGGMVRLPIIGSIISPDFKLLPKYSKGVYYYKNKAIIVSGGLGEHTFKFRLNNICEACNITIKKDNGTNTV